MNFQQLKYFLALADELHFWRTSEKTFITQSALSRHIKTLERELGVQLFERNNRNVKLTKAGEFLRDEFGRMSEEFDNVTRHARLIAAGEIGTLRIGYPASITHSVLPELLRRLSEKHPNLIAELIELTGTEFDAALLGYHIDIGFNRELPKAKGLKVKKILTENFALVIPEDHRLARKKKVNLSDAKDDWFVLPGFSGKSEHVAQMRQIFDEAGFAPRVRYESDRGAALVGLVASGLGISLLPVSYSRRAPDGLKFIEIPQTTNLYVIRRDADENAAVKNFLAIVQEFSDDAGQY
jgi:DNA-binding transcriptional LysR family regulator